MIFPLKSEQEMLEEIFQEVLANTEITDLTPGSVARTLIEIFNRRLNACYQYIDTYSAMCFLSTAQGMYLDMIGKLLACTRNSGETDQNYQYRISRQVFSAAAANRTAIRLRCLGVSNVRDVLITPYTRGNGSFSIHVITDEVDTPEDILSSVKVAVDDVKAEGIKAIVAKPKLTEMKISFNVVLKTGININQEVLVYQIKSNITSYLNTIDMGGAVSLSDVLSAANRLPEIEQIYINSLYMNGEPTIVKASYQLDWDNRIYLKDVTVNI